MRLANIEAEAGDQQLVTERNAGGRARRPATPNSPIPASDRLILSPGSRSPGDAKTMESSKTGSDQLMETTLMSETSTTPSFFDLGAQQARLLSPFLPIAAAGGRNQEIMNNIADSQTLLRGSLDANLALWRGAVTAGFGSFEAFGKCLNGSRDNFISTMNAADPIEFPLRQMDAFHNRNRELVAELRSIADQLYETWFEVIDSLTFLAMTAVEEQRQVPEQPETAIEPDETRRANESSVPDAEAETPVRPGNGTRRPLPRGRQKDA